MKKAGRILGLVLVLVMMMTAVCFAAAEGGAAGAFDLMESYPKNGSKGASVENLGVKLYFNSDFNESELGDINDKAFQLIDQEGKKLPIRVLYAPKEDGVVLVLLDSNHKDAEDYVVQGNQDYTLKIASTLQDDHGNTFGQNQEIVFKTMNTQRNMLVNMVLMTVMMGGMMFFTMKSTQKQVKEQMQAQKEEKMNPYKEAKKTGKSVEEVLEQYEKEKAKNAQKAAKKSKKDEEYYFEFDVNYRVKGPRPISEGGSAYKTGRKALAEAKKAEAAAKKAQKAAYEAKAKKKKKH